jgi:hypothetical protein
MRKAPRSPEPAKRWTAFLQNRREAIAAMDFFTVPTLTFGVLQHKRLRGMSQLVKEGLRHPAVPTDTKVSIDTIVR